MKYAMLDRLLNFEFWLYDYQKNNLHLRYNFGRVAGTTRGLIIKLRSKIGVLAMFFGLFLCFFAAKNSIKGIKKSLNIVFKNSEIVN